MVIAVVVGDFAAFGIHYLQHKVPLLWEFHKVHHSLEVMHPLSNYREHWVDNIAYALGSSLINGLVLTGVFYLRGRVEIPMVTILEVNLFALVYNLAGYNLRHSHVWIAWPGWLGYWFGSPAYHQIHHSCAPEHTDKNFAFMFPFLGPSDRFARPAARASAADTGARRWQRGRIPIDCPPVFSPVREAIPALHEQSGRSRAERFRVSRVVWKLRSAAAGEAA